MLIKIPDKENPNRIAISFPKLILCVSDDSKIIVVPTCKNMPTTTAINSSKLIGIKSGKIYPYAYPSGAIITNIKIEKNTFE